MYFIGQQRKLKLKTSSCNKKGKDFIPGSLELVKAVGGKNQRRQTQEASLRPLGQEFWDPRSQK